MRRRSEPAARGIGRKGDRLLPRPRRLDAHRGGRPPSDVGNRHRRRHYPVGIGDRAGGTRGGQCCCSLFWRWRIQYRQFPRKPQHGLAVEASGRAGMRDNGYAEFTPMSAHTVVPQVSVHGQPYGIPSQIVDGNDCCAVLEASRQAVARARAGGGPSIIECLTYRLRGHYVGDPESYRKADEVAEWRDKDPIRRFAGVLMQRRTITQSDVDGMEAAARRRVEEAVQFMAGSAWPAAATVTDLVYA